MFSDLFRKSDDIVWKNTVEATRCMFSDLFRKSHDIVWTNIVEATRCMFSDLFRKSHDIVWKNIVEPTRCMFSDLFRKSHDIVWKNIVEPDKTQMTIRRTRIAYWIPKARNIQWEYVTLMLFQCNNGYTNGPQCYVTCTGVSFLFN